MHTASISGYKINTPSFTVNQSSATHRITYIYDCHHQETVHKEKDKVGCRKIN